ncbi:MAG: Gfo/Idh/MocA family oxidoreductase [Clostridia bacterium]|nr:Gfo/Idh/MocA family oxidoreductase [Clostridia bacterium]
MIKIGVIGTGHMGRNHLRVLKELNKDFELVGFSDKMEENIKFAEETYKIKYYKEIEELLNNVDAVIIAVPSSLHKEIGLMVAKHKVHALIEKPIALSEEDGKMLCEEFEKNNVRLMVGHVERYNSVVSELKKIIDNEEIIAIEARRCSPFDPRISDTNVIYDLMIHDIDIVFNYLNITPIENITSTAVNVMSNNRADYVQAVAQHTNGTISSLIASRVTEDKVRTIDIHTKKCFIRADLLNRTLTVSRKTTFDLNVGYVPTYKQENIIEKIMLPNVEPLRAEHLEFAKAIIEGRTPLTSGKDATKAVELAEKINLVELKKRY